MQSKHSNRVNKAADWKRLACVG